VSHRLFTGGYLVSPDGTGTARINFLGDDSANFAFVITKKEIRFVRIDSGIVFGGIAKKQ